MSASDLYISACNSEFQICYSSTDQQFMAITASGDSAIVSANNLQKSSTIVASGPMGDNLTQKRPLEDGGEEPGAKKMATFSQGPGMAPLGNMNNPPGTLSETIKLPDDLVGLIIGRGGENIMRMQRETGCRIQITQNAQGAKERPCTLSGTPEQIEICRNMLNEIVARSQSGGGGGGGGPNMGPGPGGMGGPGVPGGVGGPPGIPGGLGDGEKSIVLSIPSDKCGLIIGKGGETIKMLQQNLGVRMLLIQETTENVGTPKPLKISGLPVNVDNAANAIHQMMAQRDKQIAEQQGMNPPGTGNEVQIIPVPKPAVGVVIGKGGDMISQIQSVTQTRIQFKPDDQHMPERMCTITGGKDGVEAAAQRIQEIIQNVQERDGMRGGGGGGGGGGHRNMGNPRGMGGNFGQWDGPGMMRGGGGPLAAEHHLVPANRTGLVIGKGGETIKQINMQSGAHAEIQKNPPPGSDLNYKTFIIKGTPEQIKMCRQLIQEKVDNNSGGMGGGPMRGGPPQQTPPPGNFMPQQNPFNPLSSGANFVPAQNQLQAPHQVQPAQHLQQQPWGGQFPQWTPPGGAAPAAAPGVAHHNGVDPTKAAPAAGGAAAPWQPYLQQVYGQQPGVQAPAAAATAAPAATAPAAAAAAPDYSKQWDEYLKRTGAAQAAAAVAAATATAAATAPGLQQPVAVAPATSAAATAQPATAQADYSAAWAEYYRQYYELQGQQYAALAAAGQAPAQT